MHLFMNTRSFTLVELMIVIAIIGVLITLGFGTYINIQRRARDTKRISDINGLVHAIITYEVEQGAYPGDADDLGVHISPDCASDLRNDLLNNGYISSVPSDPMSNTVGCNVGSTVPNIDNLFFYGWDSWHLDMSECISINQLETQWGVDQLIEKYGQRVSVASGGDANIGTGSNMQFNVCFAITP